MVSILSLTTSSNGLFSRTLGTIAITATTIGLSSLLCSTVFLALKQDPSVL